MTGFTIRDARRSDLEGLAALEAAAFASDRLSRASFRRLIGSETAVCRVAEAEGRRLSGYYVLLFRRNAGTARVYSIAVDPGARGHGLAATMLRDAERQARRRRRRSIRLEVRADNARAIGLYEQAGYRRIGIRGRYYADAADAVLFEKPVPARATAGAEAA